MRLVWSVPDSSKKITRRGQTGEGNVSEVGGSKTVFGEGLHGTFRPPLSFPPPLLLSDSKDEGTHETCTPHN